MSTPHVPTLGDTVRSRGTQALIGCDSVFYPFGKCKASILKTLIAGIFPGLFDILGEESATHADLMAVGQQFFAGLHNPRAPRRLKLGIKCTPTNRGSHCASCYCLRRTQTFTSTCNVLTCRCCFGRQLTNRVLQVSPSLNMAGK